MCVCLGNAALDGFSQKRLTGLLIRFTLPIEPHSALPSQMSLLAALLLACPVWAVFLAVSSWQIPRAHFYSFLLSRPDLRAALVAVLTCFAAFTPQPFALSQHHTCCLTRLPAQLCRPPVSSGQHPHRLVTQPHLPICFAFAAPVMCLTRTCLSCLEPTSQISILSLLRTYFSTLPPNSSSALPSGCFVWAAPSQPRT